MGLRYSEYYIPSFLPFVAPKTLRSPVELHLSPNRIKGPGTSVKDAALPYVRYVGRLYNNTFVPGVVRVRQGETLRVRICNNLDRFVDTYDNPPIDYSVLVPPDNPNPYPAVSHENNDKKDPNILASHLHGFYGNPGTNASACDPPLDPGIPCWRGDNIFHDILPGACADYQYDFTPYHSPGVFWLHPHKHGSTALQTHQAGMPVIVDHADASGFDYLGTPSCAAIRPYIYGAPEIIMHLQTLLFAVNSDGNGIDQDQTGPTDDGYISSALATVPQDPYCCKGPSIQPDGSGSWANTGDANGTGPDLGDSASKFPFETSGMNAEFTLTNGVYQPTIIMEAGKIYRWRIVQASISKWMDVSLDIPGCTLGLYARDGNLLRALPRPVTNIMAAAANRLELLVACAAGDYKLRTGYGPLVPDAQCMSTQCELIKDIIANIKVVPSLATQYETFLLRSAEQCRPAFPPYQADLRHVKGDPANMHYINITHKPVVNLSFTNPDPDSPASGACTINGYLYRDSYGFNEYTGQVMEWRLQNIAVHPHHRHTQPYQIVRMANLGNFSTWRVGDYADTLMLPNLGTEAVIRWLSGPADIVGTGSAVLHCHILPHGDEGCMALTYILPSAK